MDNWVDPAVSQLPGPVSPTCRDRVPKLSPRSRCHGVNHEPGPHIVLVSSVPILAAYSRPATLAAYGGTPSDMAVCGGRARGRGGSRTLTTPPVDPQVRTYLPRSEAISAWTWLSMGTHL
jgi:hypothetical protein